MRIRLRVFIILVVVGLSLWMIYPPQQTIPLGLDLNGGVQLILRVKTEGVEPGKRKAGVMVKDVTELVEKLKNEAKVI